MFRILGVINFFYCIYTLINLARLVKNYDINKYFINFIITAAIGLFCLLCYNVYSFTFIQGNWVFKIATTIICTAKVFFIMAIKNSKCAQKKSTIFHLNDDLTHLPSPPSSPE